MTASKERSPFGRSLCCAGLFQSFACSLRSTVRSQKKYNRSGKKSRYIFFCFAPGLHTLTSCACRGYCVRNTNPQEKCGLVFASTAPYFFSGCSLNPPSRLAPLTLCPGSRNANAELIFFRAVARSQSLLSASQGSAAFPVLWWQLEGRNTAWRSSEKTPLHYVFPAVLRGVWET
jgi:hypothetical protein